MLRKALIILSLSFIQITSFAHGSWQQHADDMYEVFGFERNDKLTNWMKFVSSVLIDNKNSDSAFDNSGKPYKKNIQVFNVNTDCFSIGDIILDHGHNIFKTKLIPTDGLRK